MQSLFNILILAILAFAMARVHQLERTIQAYKPLQARSADPVSQLLTIAATSNTCTGALFASECVVSSPSIVAVMVTSFAKYNVTTAAEQATLLSWMAYESGDFKYNRNHFPSPGRPGQGTRAMLMPNFVLQYARSIPGLEQQVQAATAESSDTNAVGAEVLALVQPDEYSFAAAAWYYSTYCTAEQKEQIKTGGRAGWAEAFVTGCVGTSLTDDREAYWNRACQALGV